MSIFHERCRSVFQDEDLLALSGLQHLAYCERQWALIHLEQMWTDNAETVAGELFHERANLPGYTELNGIVARRRVRLTSYTLGLYGIADIVEYGRDSSGLECVTPVEYKVGRPKLEDCDLVQVAAQAMCLEEMCGLHIDRGVLFYGKTRRREDVSIDEELRKRVSSLAHQMHELFGIGVTPPPYETRRCHRCSMRDACLPSAGPLLRRRSGAHGDERGHG